MSLQFSLLHSQETDPAAYPETKSAHVLPPCFLEIYFNLTLPIFRVIDCLCRI